MIFHSAPSKLRDYYKWIDEKLRCPKRHAKTFLVLGNLVGSISKTTFYISKFLFLSANGSFVCAKGSSILHRSSSLSKFCGMIFSLDKTPQQGHYLKQEHIWLLPCMAPFTKVLNCHSRVLP